MQKPGGFKFCHSHMAGTWQCLLLPVLRPCVLHWRKPLKQLEEHSLTLHMPSHHPLKDTSCTLALGQRKHLSAQRTGLQVTARLVGAGWRGLSAESCLRA